MKGTRMSCNLRWKCLLSEALWKLNQIWFRALSCICNDARRVTFVFLLVWLFSSLSVSSEALDWENQPPALSSSWSSYPVGLLSPVVRRSFNLHINFTHSSQWVKAAPLCPAVCGCCDLDYSSIAKNEQQS